MKAKDLTTGPSSSGHVGEHDRYLQRTTAGAQVTAVRWRWALPMAAAIALADVVTKEIVRSSFSLGEAVPVTAFFNLVFVWNPGAAFSFLASAGGWQRPLLLGVGVVVSAVLAYWLIRHPLNRLSGFALASVLGGAVGNVIDRWRHGAVVDWLDFHWAGWHWPAFNVADIGITLGVCALLLDSLIGDRVAR